VPERVKDENVSRDCLPDDFRYQAEDGLGPVVITCRALTGPERRAAMRFPRLSYYGMIWIGSGLLAIYVAGGCMWLFGPWPPQPQDRPIAWVYYLVSTVVLARVAHRVETGDKLVVHTKGFQYRTGIFYRGKIRYANVREIEIGRGLNWERLGALRLITKPEIIRAGRRTSAESVIVKTCDGNLRVMFGVLGRFAADDLKKWLEAVAINCPDRVRVSAT
jgi:hypothetical protein